MFQKMEDRRTPQEMSKSEKHFPCYNAIQKIGSGTINGAGQLKRNNRRICRQTE